MRALVRSIPDSFASALCARPPEVPIDVALARTQHALYCRALEAAGVEATCLPALETCPDCCFVEDTAVVAAGLAVVTRPGAPSRRGEIAAVEGALTGFETIRLREPATLDGGDCLRVGRTIYVGRSERTNPDGIAQLGEAFAARGLRVVPVDLPREVLHLKCVCSPLDDARILLARDTLPASLFQGVEVVWVPGEESYASNVVAVGRHALVAAEFPRTLAIVEAAGFTVHPVPTSEVRKADGALTCQSILLG